MKHQEENKKDNINAIEEERLDAVTGGIILLGDEETEDDGQKETTPVKRRKASVR